MDDKPQFEDICAVFSYGGIPSRFDLGLGASLLFGVGFLMICYVILLNIGVSSMSPTERIGASLTALVVCLGVSLGGGYILYKGVKRRKNVKIWLEDAVMVRAKVIIDNISAVSFRYNDKKYVYTKTKTDLSIVIRHEVDAVKVWYSPKYEQVMFTKESAKKVYR